MRSLVRGLLLGIVAGQLLIIGLDAALHRTRPVEAALPLTPQVPGRIVSSLYPVMVEEIPFEVEIGKGGAIEAWGESLLLATRTGKLLRLADGDPPAFRPLPLPPPFDMAVQAMAAEPRYVGVRDLKIVAAGAPGMVRLLLSTVEVEVLPDGTCLRNLIRTIEIPRAWVETGADPAGAAPRAWSTLHRGADCARTPGADSVVESGGAMTVAPDGRILLSVGTYGTWNGEPPGPLAPQDPATTYGKVLAIDPGTGAGEVFTLGHRNVSGLVTMPDGRILSVEHGPRGGDELNLLVEGTNYGHPLASYGTDYGGFALGTDPTPGDHGGFARPVFAWVPSIAVSSVAAVSGPEFPSWEGDLLVASLVGGRLDRVRIREGRAVVIEPLPVGWRVRDIAVDARGRIYAKLSTLPVVLRLTNGLDGGGAARALLLGCAGCHQVDGAMPPVDAAPSLVGILGREVASQPGYAYSAALRSAGGQWDRDRLLDFLTRRREIGAGSAMMPPDLDRVEAAMIVDLLAGTGATPTR